MTTCKEGRAHQHNQGGEGEGRQRNLVQEWIRERNSLHFEDD